MIAFSITCLQTKNHTRHWVVGYYKKFYFLFATYSIKILFGEELALKKCFEP